MFQAVMTYSPVLTEGCVMLTMTKISLDVPSVFHILM